MLKVSFHKKPDGPDLCREYYLHGKERHASALYDMYYLLTAGLCNHYLKDPDTSRSLAIGVFQRFLEEARKEIIASPHSWLYRAARNACLKHIRDNKKYIVTDEVPEPGDAGEPFEETPMPDRVEMLESCLPRLQEEQRDCIRLFYLEGLSYRQVCEKTGFTYMQVKSFIQNGKRNLRLMMEKIENGQTG